MNLDDKNKLLPWSEKYRPNEIDNIIYHEKIKHSIVNYMDNKRLPHLLFYGPAGVGKTSLITAIAKHYYQEDFDNMILILNASEERGIETVRNRIKQFFTTIGLAENPNTPSFKLIILDEIDAMTEDAQAILRKVVEKYVNNVRFCFICNYLKKINPAIQSRCIIFRFKPIPQPYLEKFVLNVCEKENMKITKEGMNLIIKRTIGDMRKLLNILQSIYMYVDSTKSENDCVKINEKNVSKILSCPTEKHIISILNIIQEKDLKTSCIFIENLINKNGLSLNELIGCVYEYFMDSIINNNKSIIKYSEEQCVKIIKNMSLINENLTYCNTDNIQLISFIALFYL
jgi:replication factor C subunit 3/5